MRAQLGVLEQRINKVRGGPLTEQNLKGLKELQDELAIKQRDYEILLSQIKATTPEYADMRKIDPLKLEEVQRLLDKDTTLLSYYVTPQATLVFIIGPNSFKVMSLPIKEMDLRKTIAWFRHFSNLRNPFSLKELSEQLITPLKPYLTTPVIGVIPHGILNYLPFAALPDGRDYLGDKYTLFYVPSASVMPFILKKRKPIGDKLLALAQSRAEGLPLLLNADSEASEVANIYHTKALIGTESSKNAFLSVAPQFSMIHIAAHAELNATNPLFSRIMFAPYNEDGGILELREIYGLDLSEASLVVLSACETQIGPQSKGDDIVGLSRAFLDAGTPSVVASLWPVDDEATSLFMKSFYTHLRQGVMSKAASLAAAQRETRARYPHPYYWAGFVLSGDPGTGTAAKTKH